MPDHCRASAPGLWLAAALLASGAAAQVPQESAPPASPETALITVTAPPLAGRVLAPGVSLAESALIDRQPRTVAEALRGLPGVAVRTNSRGETIVRVRGAEERQTQVFLDGAPLGVPWDGRIDLGLVPAGAITGLSVRKGAVPIEYGTNAVAGVVDLQTRRSGTLFSAQAGTLGLYTLSGAAGLDAGPVNLLIAARGRMHCGSPIQPPCPFHKTPAAAAPTRMAAPPACCWAPAGRLARLICGPACCTSMRHAALRRNRIAIRRSTRPATGATPASA
jgi:iron complex outermembrane receptor protein